MQIMLNMPNFFLSFVVFKQIFFILVEVSFIIWLGIQMDLKVVLWQSNPTSNPTLNQLNPTLTQVGVTW